jgi:hypothetical protein
VIVLAVRWYLRFGLSFRDVEEPLAERGIEVDHVTVYWWVQRFTPLLAEAARRAARASVTAGRWMRPSPSFLDSSVKLGVNRANGVLPKVREQSGPWTSAAARLGHLPAGQLGNTLRRLETGH